MIAKSMANLLLAGDVGGTTMRLGLFAPAPARPRPLAVRAFGTLDYGGLPQAIDAFLRIERASQDDVAAACIAVAGPVIDDAADVTNVPWHIDRRGLARAFRFGSVRLLNDLEALAHAVPLLEASELLVLQDGRPLPEGNMAIIAAGTGLGEALLVRIDSRLVPSPSEGGHADFSARSEREIALLRDLTGRYGRADVERVVSGHGLINIHRVSHNNACTAGIDLDEPGAPALITGAALERRCAGCVETLDLFVDAYGAEAGNLALRTVATGGVFIGGGIAPKILPALQTGAFLRAFCAKAPLEAMLCAIPVKIVLNEEAGLLGAAIAVNSI